MLGVDVGATADPEERVRRMLADLALDGLTAPLADRSSLRVRRDQVGAGYGVLNAGSRRALVDAAHCEGIILDPVYTAKALSGLAAEVRDGKIAPDEPTVFVHTGGLPGLFGHPFIDDPRAAPGGSKKKGAAMARRKSVRSQLYRAARDLGNAQAAAKGPGAFARRQVRRSAYRRTNRGLSGLLRAFGLSGRRGR